MTGSVHLLLGAYVLGGLSTDERRIFEQHLDGCARCRAELAAAAPIPGMLRRVPGEPGAGTPVPDGGVPPALLSAVREQRRRQRLVRWIAVSLVVCVAVVVGIVVAGLM
jgi:anti-sigma factor RsiW